MEANFNNLPQMVSMLLEKIDHLQSAILAPGETEKADIVDTKQLCERLQITEPTVIRWRNKGKIPFYTIGTAIRFDFNKVLSALEAKKKGGRNG